MRSLHNILALAPCGKPQAAHFAHLVELLQWQPERVNFTNLEHCGGRSARTHARWFARDFPFARLAVAALGAAHPLPVEGAPGPFSLRNPRHHNLEQEIHKRIGTGSAPGRNPSNSGAGRCRIPPERLWLRAPPRASGPAGP